VSPCSLGQGRLLGTQGLSEGSAENKPASEYCWEEECILSWVGCSQEIYGENIEGALLKQAPVLLRVEQLGGEENELLTFFSYQHQLQRRSLDSLFHSFPPYSYFIPSARKERAEEREIICSQR